MKAFLKFVLLAVIVTQVNSKVDWEQNPHDTEKMFYDIPHYIDMKQVRFSFKMTNWFITGLERGLYNDTSLVVNSDCFGD
jgi:hypothetical protein